MSARMSRLGLAVGLAVPALAGAGVVQAAPWVGTADYTLAPGATGDEDLVGPFDRYDFANGVVLFQRTTAAGSAAYNVGDVFTGYFQSYVVAHQLGGVGVPSPNLNIQGAAGSGSGYELTTHATFRQQVAAVTPVPGFPSVSQVTFSALPWGLTDVHFDTTPDYSFTLDAGFQDGTSILTGSVLGGFGTLFVDAIGAPVFGFGATALSLFVGPQGYNTTVFEPDTIGGASSIFTLQINPFGASNGVTQVQSVPVAGGLLLDADGNLDLIQAVPLPPALWLLGPVLVGLLGVGRRTGGGEPRAA